MVVERNFANQTSVEFSASRIIRIVFHQLSSGKNSSSILSKMVSSLDKSSDIKSTKRKNNNMSDLVPFKKAMADMIKIDQSWSPDRKEVVLKGQVEILGKYWRPDQANSDAQYQYMVKATELMEVRDQKLEEKMEEIEKSLRHDVAELEKKMDNKFVELEKKMDNKFVELEKKVDKRFAELEKKFDQKFEQLEGKIDKKFGDVNDLLQRILSRLE